MSELLSEQAAPLAEVLRRVLGRHISPATRWRWVTKGVAGVRLEVFVAGGRLYSTFEAVNRFIAATTAARIQRVSESPGQTLAEVMSQQPPLVASHRRTKEVNDSLRRRGLA